MHTARPGTPGGPLDGMSVGVTADRRAEEQSELLARRGARVLRGPTVRTLPLTDGAALRTATLACIDEPPDVVVLSTALGVRAWAEAAEGQGLGDELTRSIDGATVLARGPKASGAAVTAGWHVDWVSPLASSAEVLDHLRRTGVDGARVAVQLDGRVEPVLADAVASLGAEVVAVPVYRWELPADHEPALRLIEATVAGTLDAVTFTSSPAVWNIERLARDAGLDDALRERLAGPVLRVCVGPVCAGEATRAGYTNIVQPERSRLGSMVKALAARVGEDRTIVVLDGLEVQLLASSVVVGDQVVDLTPREHDVLEVLARRPGSVVTKAQLLVQVWHGEADGHAVEVTVGRLRRRLGDAIRIQTVPRRGYRLAGA